MPRLTQDERNQAMGMLQAGMQVRHIAAALNCVPSTIRRLQQRYEETGSVQDRPRDGRPHATTVAQDRQLVRRHLQNRFTPATQTATQLRVSSRTVRRRLATAGLVARRPFIGPILTPRHCLQRLTWAQEHVRWTAAKWRSVLFTDESRFCLHQADGRLRVWRRQGERMAPDCVLQADSWCARSIMVWGGISRDHRTPLHVFESRITAAVYQEDVLQNIVVPFLRNHRHLAVLQQDNATPHSARRTQDYLRQEHVTTLPCPSLSPDLSPIEHLWDQLGRRVTGHNPRTCDQLQAAILQEWDNIPQTRITRLVGSMRSRCNAIIAARGGHTRY